MKVKEDSVKAGLHLNTKKTDIMTTEEIYNFNVDNEDIEIKHFPYLGSVHSNGDFSQKIKRRLDLEGQH